MPLCGTVWLIAEETKAAFPLGLIKESLTRYLLRVPKSQIAVTGYPGRLECGRGNSSVSSNTVGT